MRWSRAALLISLIIPARERSTYLAECIRPATAIPDPGIEVVVSDNASKDGTAGVMAAQRDPRIVSLRTERTGTADAVIGDGMETAVRFGRRSPAPGAGAVARALRGPFRR